MQQECTQDYVLQLQWSIFVPLFSISASNAANRLYDAL